MQSNPRPRGYDETEHQRELARQQEEYHEHLQHLYPPSYEAARVVSDLGGGYAEGLPPDWDDDGYANGHSPVTYTGDA